VRRRHKLSQELSNIPRRWLLALPPAANLNSG
jgi:hypothetical protein